MKKRNEMAIDLSFLLTRSFCSSFIKNAYISQFRSAQEEEEEEKEKEKEKEKKRKKKRKKKREREREKEWAKKRKRKFNDDDDSDDTEEEEDDNPYSRKYVGNNGYASGNKRKRANFTSSGAGAGASTTTSYRNSSSSSSNSNSNSTKTLKKLKHQNDSSSSSNPKKPHQAVYLNSSGHSNGSVALRVPLPSNPKIVMLQCGWCGKLCGGGQALGGHLRVHSGEEGYPRMPERWKGAGGESGSEEDEMIATPTTTRDTTELNNSPTHPPPQQLQQKQQQLLLLLLQQQKPRPMPSLVLSLSKASSNKPTISSKPVFLLSSETCLKKVYAGQSGFDAAARISAALGVPATTTTTNGACATSPLPHRPVVCTATKAKKGEKKKNCRCPQQWRLSESGWYRGVGGGTGIGIGPGGGYAVREEDFVKCREVGEGILENFAVIE